mgnify:CR=1 FL=1
MTETIGKNFIDGAWTAATGAVFTKYHPLTNAPIWTGNETRPEEVAHALTVARTAFLDWASTPLQTRIAIVQRFAELVTTHQDKLAHIISQETSKPLWETATEVAAVIGKVAISVQAYHERTGEKSTAIADGVASLRHRPHGVLAVFGPYNFPAHLPNGHIVPALLAGNTLILKPSELTPWTAEYMLTLWQQAGLPAGVLNLVQGGRDTGVALTDLTELDGILFTGSASTGFVLHEKFAKTPHKILALEMGGNNPLIINDFNDEKAVVNLALQSAFLSAGQRCTCARRILVKKGAAGDAFVAAFVAAADKLIVGHYEATPAPFMGGVISQNAVQALLSAQDKLQALGATTLLPMRRLDEHSTLLSPGILEVTGISVPDEEYFGPLTTIIRYADFDEALALANATRFGLSCSLVSQERALFERLLIEGRAGIINWNKPTTGAASSAPFGGVGASGNHRPSAYYAADYCAYPVASMESTAVALPKTLPQGVVL